MSDIYRTYNYTPDDDSVKIPDVEFETTIVPENTISELSPEDAFVEFSENTDMFSQENQEQENVAEEQEEIYFPTREELAQYYRDELNAIALEVEIKAYSDALNEKKAQIQQVIDGIPEKINQMEELQKAFFKEFEEKLKFFSIDIAEKFVQKKIQEDDLYLEELVKKTVSECKGTDWMKVEISDALASLVEAAKQELRKPEYKGVAEVKPIATADDTCVVSTETGAVVATISVQADNLRTAFKEAQMEV